MFDITDKMVDDFYGEYEIPERFNEVVSKGFFDDLFDEDFEEDCNGGTFCI